MDRILLALATLAEPLGAILVVAAALAAVVGGPFVAKRFPAGGEGVEGAIELLARLSLVALLGGGLLTAGAALRLRSEESMETWRWGLVAATAAGAIGSALVLGGPAQRAREEGRAARRFRLVLVGGMLLALAGGFAASFLALR